MTRRVLIALIAGVLLLAVGGIAVAALRSDARGVRPSGLHQEGSNDQGEADQGVHGGSVERFHGPGCDVPSGSDLSGNWTHGDFVSAWAATGDAERVREAAHSRCGKPAHAGLGRQGKGQKPANRNGPPETVPAGPPTGLPPEPQPPSHS